MKRLTVILALIGGVVFVAWLPRPGGQRGGLDHETRCSRENHFGSESGGRIQEFVPDDPLARTLLGENPQVRDFVETLERAAADKRVTGLLARIGSGGGVWHGPRKSGTPSWPFARPENGRWPLPKPLGKAPEGNQGYYLASAFDEIILQPSGDVGLTGICWNPFLRGTLDKLGVVPRMDQRYEYKNAMNMFTETAFTPPHREAIQAILDSWFNQLVGGIAQGRKLPEAEVRALIDRGPFLGQEAVKARLVDRLGYRDEVFSKVLENAGPKARLLYWDKYLEQAKPTP